MLFNSSSLLFVLQLLIIIDDFGTFKSDCEDTFFKSFVIVGVGIKIFEEVLESLYKL
jgi:hypothetical protein